jgi:hypothetical protein
LKVKSQGRMVAEAALAPAPLAIRSDCCSTVLPAGGHPHMYFKLRHHQAPILRLILIGRTRANSTHLNGANYASVSEPTRMEAQSFDYHFDTYN